ncbi:MAG TPA: ELWxxDGT repeat protein, partial [Thermoanaerobaculia bacterium]|nr:ELWxxDGT repeat protein [Thermoanaerobaculia bacterium]
VRTPRPERPLNQATILDVVGSRVYFTADDGAHGVELWKTDGNPAATQLVADLTPGPGGSDVVFGQPSGDGLYFVARVAGVPDILWHTRGTAASTFPIAGTSDVFGGLAFRGGLFWVAEPAEGVSALAWNDGTTDGTRILFQGARAPSSSPAGFVATPKGLLFVADDGVHGGEVWRTDGRRSGTRLLADLMPSNDGLLPRLFSSRDGVFISTVDFALGEGQTVQWSDGGSEPPRLLLRYPELSYAQGFVETGAGTSFFLERGNSGSGLELWGSDGTVSGTGSLAVIDPDPEPSHQIFATAGPEPGIATFLFQVNTSTIDRPSALFETDGTSGGTRELGRPAFIDNSTTVLGLVSAAGQSFLLLLDYGSQSASKLWVSDGTAAGTRELFRIDNPFGHSFISDLVPAGDRLYFIGDEASGGRELWVTDGTVEGTARVANIAPGSAGSAPSDLFAFGNRLFFGADDGAHGRELWVTDGTAAGTRQIEIRPGPRGSYPQAFAAIGDHVVFAADDGVHGLEMWESDGTTAGTRLVADVMPGPLGSCPAGFTAFGADLFFSAGRPNVGYELFRVPMSILDAQSQNQEARR